MIPDLTVVDGNIPIGIVLYGDRGRIDSPPGTSFHIDSNEFFFCFDSVDAHGELGGL
jgi:hypothetical protein